MSRQSQRHKEQFEVRYRVALVGGHPSMIRKVTQELSEKHGLQKAVEILSSKESRNSRSSVQSKISNCNLIAVVTGYMGHDLKNIVQSLEKGGSLLGQVLWLPPQVLGKNQVIQVILESVPN